MPEAGITDRVSKLHINKKEVVRMNHPKTVNTEKFFLYVEQVYCLILHKKTTLATIWAMMTEVNTFSLSSFYYRCRSDIFIPVLRIKGFICPHVFSNIPSDY